MLIRIRCLVCALQLALRDALRSVTAAEEERDSLKHQLQEQQAQQESEAREQQALVTRLQQQLQQDTGGFLALLVWVYLGVKKPFHSKPDGRQTTEWPYWLNLPRLLAAAQAAHMAVLHFRRCIVRPGSQPTGRAAAAAAAAAKSH